MTFHTLEHTDTATITATFNEAFSDYIVPLQLSEQQLADKLKSDSIRLDLSVGVFEKDKLTGFILHGYDETEGLKVVYNGGTGVIPAMRGQKLTAQLYQYALPLLKGRGVDKVILEVITDNIPAIKTYRHIGFGICRTLLCYKGPLHLPDVTDAFHVRPLLQYDWPLLKSFWDWKPSWQNAPTALEHLQDTNIAVGAYHQDACVGYLVFNPKMNRIQQFAVSKPFRHQGVARQLFRYIAANYSKEVSMINVDEAAEETNRFLRKIGLGKHVMQYEMEMNLP